MTWDDTRPVKSGLLTMWEMATDAATYGVLAFIAHVARGNPGAADMDWWLAVVFWGAGTWAAVSLSFLAVMLAIIVGGSLVVAVLLVGALVLHIASATWRRARTSNNLGSFFKLRPVCPTSQHQLRRRKL